MCWYVHWIIRRPFFLFSLFVFFFFCPSLFIERERERERDLINPIFFFLTKISFFFSFSSLFSSFSLLFSSFLFDSLVFYQMYLCSLMQRQEHHFAPPAMATARYEVVVLQAQWHHPRHEILGVGMVVVVVAAAAAVVQVEVDVDVATLHSLRATDRQTFLRCCLPSFHSLNQWYCHLGLVSCRVKVSCCMQRRKRLPEPRNPSEEVRRVVPTISVQRHMMVHQQCVSYELRACPLGATRSSLKKKV